MYLVEIIVDACIGVLDIVLDEIGNDIKFFEFCTFFLYFSLFVSFLLGFIVEDIWES